MNQTGSLLPPLKTSEVTVHLGVLRKQMNLVQHDGSCSPMPMNTSGSGKESRKRGLGEYTECVNPGPQGYL